MKIRYMILLLLLGLVAHLVLLYADDKPVPAPTLTKMSAEDQYHLKAVNLELSIDQFQLQELAKQLKVNEKSQEQTALLKKVCGSIPLDQCDANTDTGEVKQKVANAPPPPPAKPPIPDEKKK